MRLRLLDGDFDMPPLMLTPDELEAAVLDAQWVADKGDAVLAAAARDLIAKISAPVPEHLRPFIANPTIGPTMGAPPGRETAPDGIDAARTRQWIRGGRKIHISYRDDQGRKSERTIWPVIIGYAETVRLLAAGASCVRRSGIFGWIASSPPSSSTCATAAGPPISRRNGRATSRPSAASACFDLAGRNGCLRPHIGPSAQICCGMNPDVVAIVAERPRAISGAA